MSICVKIRNISFTLRDRTPPRHVASFQATPTGKAETNVTENQGNPFKNIHPSSSVESTAASGSIASSSTTPDKEARLEAMETSIREGRRKMARQIPIRGVNQPASKDTESSGQYAEWKEWQLLPEGFEQMPLAQKITELYLGKRGFMFWTNKLAYGAAISLLGGWVLFRLVLPGIGLYKLAGDVTPPTF
ncbi:hypothetical protein CEUSTIGMA_g5258.t1 [Chlamydomonas eustigma]|uniref:Uncharacterized protein n=1 Tax=Chlamydomonas eustigma TaxID=1157962 RepID=A0A250X416_9CHLO|nr:hypothetical protein CEUSTIGMA_g5258.t1 [Chlamydomonas eustigma]|eukprot:GAX77815.1 hypothetical protein CEUSTIGMA_g5258.t1 [Chlamydomonas eustigma]